MKGKNDALKWIFKNSRQIFIKLLIIIITSVALATFGVMLALASRSVIDVATGQAKGDLISNSINLFLIIIGQIILQSITSNINIRANGILTLNMKKNIFNHLLQNDWQSVSAYHSGDLLNRINSDVSVVVAGVIGILPTFLSLVTKLVASFWVLFSLDPTFAAFILILGPMVIVFARIYSKKMKIYHKKCQEADGKISSFMQESIQNLLMIKSFKSEEYIVDKSTQLQLFGFKIKIKRNTISIFANIGLYLIFSAGYYMALAWGAYRLSKGMITFGTMTLFLQLISQVQAPFMNLSSLLPQYYNMIASAERIIEIERLPVEISYYEDLNETEVYDSLDKILIENLTFSYDKEVILDNTSYEIKKGDFVAVAGTSGVGKSTLVKLILGIITPQEGMVYLKLKNGDMLRVDKYTRKIFAYVPQGNMILSGSIRDNIKFSTKDASEEQIIEAAKTAAIWDFIEQLPDGLDTVIGERGLGLSEGQIQRIAIARALLYNSPVLLLDEATSALDENTEKTVLKNLKALQDKMCIIISHKKAAMEICDEIISIINGKIIKFRE